VIATFELRASPRARHKGALVPYVAISNGGPDVVHRQATPEDFERFPSEWAAFQADALSQCGRSRYASRRGVPEPAASRSRGARALEAQARPQAQVQGVVTKGGDGGQVRHG
jgi:hypothetical protein